MRANTLKANRIPSLDREISGAPSQWKVSCRVDGKPLSFIKNKFSECQRALNELRKTKKVTETILAEV